MATKTQNQQLVELKHEVVTLRSFIIGLAGRDPEGEYNPKFVQSIIEASQEEPTEEFKDPQSFLKSLK